MAAHHHGSLAGAAVSGISGAAFSLLCLFGVVVLRSEAVSGDPESLWCWGPRLGVARSA